MPEVVKPSSQGRSSVKDIKGIDEEIGMLENLYTNFETEYSKAEPKNKPEDKPVRRSSRMSQAALDLNLHQEIINKADAAATPESKFARGAAKPVASKRFSNTALTNASPRSLASLNSPKSGNGKGRFMRSITDDIWTKPKGTSREQSRRNSRGSMSGNMDRFKGMEHLPGFATMNNQEKIAAHPGGCQLCRRHLLGICPNGDDCTYLHDLSVMKPDEQKVFIGGIPKNCTSKLLVKALTDIGYPPINLPKCHPSGFSPKVALESVEKARRLLRKARIKVGDNIADVRKYADSRAKDPSNKKVFIANLPEECTAETLMEGIEDNGFMVEREPIINSGENFCQCVEIATVEMVDAMVILEKIPIKDKYGIEHNIVIKRYEGDPSSAPQRRGTRTGRPTGMSSRLGHGAGVNFQELRRRLVSTDPVGAAAPTSRFGTVRSTGFANRAAALRNKLANGRRTSTGKTGARPLVGRVQTGPGGIPLIKSKYGRGRGGSRGRGRGAISSHLRTV